MLERSLEVQRLGRVAYADGLDLQKRLETEVIGNREQDFLLLLEHPHTFTLGRRSKNEGVLATADMLRKIGVEVFEINRGGKVTYHGLGQIVGYPIISLSPDREDVHKYVRDVEEVLIRTMADFGIEAFRIEGLTGVHTTEGKVAAIGVHIKRWVTTHGFALNVNTDLSYYNWIIACEGEPVTSMARLLDREIDISEVEDRIVENFKDVFGYDVSNGRHVSEPAAVATGSSRDLVESQSHDDLDDTSRSTRLPTGNPVATAPGSDSSPLVLKETI
ncbi:MAG: lipoyl(octanoyl) transferase [Acidobacteria bacterium]|nr:MAG: lipoyl(octanoyl) transferase [Acidobacteriota bacterium]